MSVEEQPHLLQMFLSRTLVGVFEVSVVLSSNTLVCTCPGFGSRRRCKHVSYVKSEMTPSGGYLAAIAVGSKEALQEAVHQGPAAWREFVCLHTLPVVL